MWCAGKGKIGEGKMCVFLLLSFNDSWDQLAKIADINKISLMVKLQMLLRCYNLENVRIWVV